jgi:hypothetical protein
MTNFNEFWQLAKGCRGRLNPGSRPKAEEKWDKAVKAGADPREIIAGWLGYQSAMDDTDTDFLYRLMATTFLNQWIWENYLDEGAAKAYLAGPKLEVVK